MSDSTAPDERPSPNDDELVSRVLDGEAEPGDADAIAADPVLRQRLDEFTAIATAMSEPAMPAARARDAAIAAALDAVATGDDREDSVVALESRRRPRPGWIAGAAAAAVLLVVAAAALPALLRSGSTARDTSAAAQTTVAAAAPEPQAGSSASEATTGNSTASTAVGQQSLESLSALGDLGTFASSADLAATLRASAADSVTSTTVQRSAAATSSPDYTFAQNCAALVAGTDGLGTPVAAGTATVAGQRVVVIVVRADTGAPRAVLADAVTCATQGAPIDL